MSALSSDIAIALTSKLTSISYEGRYHCFIPKAQKNGDLLKRAGIWYRLGKPPLWT